MRDRRARIAALSLWLTSQKGRPIAINDSGSMIVSGEDGGFLKNIVPGPLTSGNGNCDGTIDLGDVSPLVLVLADPTNHGQTYPDGYWEAADANGDGQIDFGGVHPFVKLSRR